MMLGDTRTFELTGNSLIGKINALSPKLVIDVGCGANYFKGKIHNLIGFDEQPHDNVDHNSAIADMKFIDESADVILALGSLQYINRENIIRNITTVVKWLKPGGFLVMRVQPLMEEKDAVIISWRWSREFLDLLGDQLGLRLVDEPVLEKQLANPSVVRHTWWWQKK